MIKYKNVRFAMQMIIDRPVICAVGIRLQKNCSDCSIFPAKTVWTEK